VETYPKAIDVDQQRWHIKCSLGEKKRDFSKKRTEMTQQTTKLTSSFENDAIKREGGGGSRENLYEKIDLWMYVCN